MKVIDVKAGIEEGKDTFKMPLKTPEKHTTLVITLNMSEQMYDRQDGQLL